MESLSEYAKFFAGLLAIVNPIGAVPIFIELTANQSTAQRKHTSSIAALATGVILLIALFCGEGILKFFGISIASFRVGGGILILLMAISMLHAKMSAARHTQEETEDAVDRDSLAVVPLGMPLLAGPGAISTVIVYTQRHESFMHYVVLGGEILLVSLAVLISFRVATHIAKYLGKTGINLVTRIMGLIMAAIGVEFIASGIRQLFPILG